MSEQEQLKRRIPWHRTRIDRRLLAELNRRSDLLGFAQTLGYLAALTATGSLRLVGLHPLRLVLVRRRGLPPRNLLRLRRQRLSRALPQLRLPHALPQRLLPPRAQLHRLAQPGAVLGQPLRAPQVHPLPAGGRRGGAACRDDPEGVPARRLRRLLGLLPEGQDDLPARLLPAAQPGMAHGAVSAGERRGTPPPVPLGPRPPLRARRHRRGRGLAGLVAGAPALHLRHPVRPRAVPAVQQQPARGPHRRGAGLPPELAHLPPQSGGALPLLAHELPHRAPHVRRGPLLPARPPAQGDPPRAAPLPQGLVPMWREIAGILRRQKREPGFQFVPELPEKRRGRPPRLSRSYDRAS